MAIYHFEIKKISRGQGNSTTAVAAHHAAQKITDERTGITHNHTRMPGTKHSQIILPGGGSVERGVLWNRIEFHHKRGDAVLAREVEIALPAELSTDQRQALAVGFARELADRYGVAADITVHAPIRDGDERNHHAHIMLSACYIAPDGDPGKKAVELDPVHCRYRKLDTMAHRERRRWAELVNTALERAGFEARVDHRTLEEQGIERLPPAHLGPVATRMERRGIQTELGNRNRDIKEQNSRLRAISARIADLGAGMRNYPKSRCAIKQCL